MNLLRIVDATPLEPHRLRLTLSDGTVIERDVEHLLVGSILAPIRDDPSVFAAVRVENGTVVWPNGADLCPDVIIWGGLPPREATAPAATG